MTDRGGLELPSLPCACASLRRAARAVTQLYDTGLRETGVPMTQFTLLQVLDRRGEVSQGDLGDVLALDSSTLTRTLQPLASRSWIRSRTGDDKRVVYWSITAAGKRTLERAKPAWESLQRRLRGRIGAERWTTLMADLTAVAESARDS